MPKIIKGKAETLVEDLKTKIETQNEENRNKIDSLSIHKNISELCKILRELNKQKNQSLKEYAENKLKEILSSAKTKIKSAIFNKNWYKVFNKAPILITRDELKDLINNSETTLSEIYQEIEKLINKNLDTLKNINSKNRSEELVEAFSVYKAFIKFKTKISKDPKYADIFGVFG